MVLGIYSLRTGRVFLPRLLILIGGLLAFFGFYNLLLPEMGQRDALIMTISVSISGVVAGIVGRITHVSNRLLYLFIGLPMLFVTWIVLDKLFPR